MTRRPLLPIAALIATMSLVIAACSGGATAPALTDPAEILAQSVASLKDVKTVEFVGTLTGKLEVAEMGGSLDLSTTTMAGALDIPNQKAKFTLDAPSLMNTKVEALLVDGFAYVKIDGMLAGMTGLTPGKYTKVEVPEASGEPVSDPSQIAASVEEFEKKLAELPSQPTKEADEKCGDQDCYHVRIAMTAEDLAKLSPEAAAAGEGDFTLDIWSHEERPPAGQARRCRSRPPRPARSASP